MRIWKVDIAVRWKKKDGYDSLGTVTVKADTIEEAITKAIEFERKSYDAFAFEAQNVELFAEIDVE